MTKTCPTYVLALLAFLVVGLRTAEAQCAGMDNTVTVCEKDLNPAYQNFDLFSQLLGSPATGGTWSAVDIDNSPALDANTGMLNLWQITNHGIHEFVYDNPDCGEQATITLELGGYPGEDNLDGSANTCNYFLFVNLHEFIGSEEDGLVQDFNGIWQMVSPNTPSLIDDNHFLSAMALPGEYLIRYTVPSVGTCPARTSLVLLEVHEPPEVGSSEELFFCATDDFSGFTAVDLQDLIDGEDPFGTWEEGITNQISDEFDNIINLQEIRNTHGIGSYAFSYSFENVHPVCFGISSSVIFTISPVLQGSLEVTSGCASDAIIIDLDYDETIFYDDDYWLTYDITDAEGNSIERTVLTELINGVAQFSSSVTGLEMVNPLTVSLVDIRPENGTLLLCDDFDVTPFSFEVHDPQIALSNICVDTELNITVNSVLDAITELPTDDVLDIAIVLTDPNDVITPLTIENAAFNNGSTTFMLPAEHFSEGGAYTLEATVLGSFSDCPLDVDFDVIPTPSEIALDLEIDNNCDATTISLVIDAPELIDSEYTVSYQVIALGDNDVLVENTINFSGGDVIQEIDIETLPVGDYRVLVQSDQNDNTPCRLVTQFSLEQDFTIGGIPAPPTFVTDQSFCEIAFDDNGPTLADIQITSTGPVNFFADENSTAILPDDTPLVDGAAYYVQSLDPITGCEGSQRLAVRVSFYIPDSVSTFDTEPLFCASDDPTLADIVVLAPNGGTIQWFASATGGEALDIDAPLVTEQAYYAYETTVDGCSNPERLLVTPTVVTVDAPMIDDNDFFVCALDAPTVEDLETLELPGQDIRWYDRAEGGESLSSETRLFDDIFYYAESYDLISQCVHPERAAVFVDLNGCDPTIYDFYIPDGFSPNGDGRNDTFFIPNIEIIFPNYSLEIFNRYGNSIFRGNAENREWDGKDGNGQVPNGVYFYVLHYNREGFEPVQGRLYLNR